MTKPVNRTSLVLLGTTMILSAVPLAAQANAFPFPSASTNIAPREENAAKWVSGELEKRGYQPIGPSRHLARLLGALGWQIAVKDTSGTQVLHERDTPCPLSSTRNCQAWDVTYSVFTWARDSSSLSLNLMLGTVVQAGDSVHALPITAELRRDSSDVADAYAESPEANETRKCLAWEKTMPPHCRTYAPKN